VVDIGIRVGSLLGQEIPLFLLVSSIISKKRIRWEDVVQRDALQILGIQGWRSWAKDREDGGAF
jgi:hypothetical protein